jgi:hypothetical protein
LLELHLPRNSYALYDSNHGAEVPQVRARSLGANLGHLSAPCTS